MGVHHPVVEGWLDNFKILSLAENCRSPQMWAHYTDNYQGICIEFDTEEEFRDILPVEYIPESAEHPHYYEPDHMPSDIDTIVVQSYLQKCLEWNYEREWRVIRNSSEGDFYDFSRTSIKSILLGIKISEENKNIIVSLADKYSIPVKKMFISNRNYKIHFLDYNVEPPWDGSNIEDYVCKNL